MRRKSPFSFGNVAWMSVSVAADMDPEHITLTARGNNLIVSVDGNIVDLRALNTVRGKNSSKVATAFSHNFLKILADRSFMNAYAAAVKIINEYSEGRDKALARLCKLALGQAPTGLTS